MSNYQRTCKLDIDYKEYHNTRVKVAKVRQSVVMSTVRERAIINEKSCASNIQDFFDTNALEETDEIDDLVECIKRIAEISKEYRHAHAELEALLGEKYMHDYTNSRQVAERMKEYTKNAKSKLKNLEKRKELEIKENYAEFDRKKIV